MRFFSFFVPRLNHSGIDREAEDDFQLELEVHHSFRGLPRLREEARPSPSPFYDRLRDLEGVYSC